MYKRPLTRTQYPVLGGSLDEGQIPIGDQLGYIVTYVLVLKNCQITGFGYNNCSSQISFKRQRISQRESLVLSQFFDSEFFSKNQNWWSFDIVNYLKNWNWRFFKKFKQPPQHCLVYGKAVILSIVGWLPKRSIW